MADSNGPRVLTDDRTAERYSAVVRVLYRVLFLNLAVAVVKIVLGYFTGAVSILSDGFHSLTDTASNVVALIGVSIARRPPDEDHPYGHRKYETFASLGILVFLILVLVQVLGAAYDRLISGGTPRVSRRDWHHGRDAGRQSVRRGVRRARGAASAQRGAPGGRTTHAQ